MGRKVYTDGRMPADKVPTTPEKAPHHSDFTGSMQLGSIPTPTAQMCADAGRYMTRVAPDLLDVLGLGEVA